MENLQPGDKLKLVKYENTDASGYFGQELRRLAALPFVTFDHYGNGGKDKDIVYVKELPNDGMFTSRLIPYKSDDTDFQIGDKVILVDGDGWFDAGVSLEHLTNQILTVVAVDKHTYPDSLITVVAPKGMFIAKGMSQTGGHRRRFAKI